MDSTQTQKSSDTASEKQLKVLSGHVRMLWPFLITARLQLPQPHRIQTVSEAKKECCSFVLMWNDEHFTAVHFFTSHVGNLTI